MPLSRSVCSPAISSATSLPHSLATSRTTRGKAAEELLDGHHANLQNALVQFIQDAGLKRQRFGKLHANGIAARAADQIPRSVRCSIDLPMINSPTRFMTASMRAASTRKELSATAATAEAPAVCFALGASCPSSARALQSARPALPRSRREVRVPPFRLRGLLDAQIGNDGRNPAAMGNVFYRMGAGEGRFHNFHGCRGEIVFRPKSDHCAAGVQDVSYQAGMRRRAWRCWDRCAARRCRLFRHAAPLRKSSAASYSFQRKLAGYRGDGSGPVVQRRGALQQAGGSSARNASTEGGSSCFWYALSMLRTVSTAASTTSASVVPCDLRRSAA